MGWKDEIQVRRLMQRIRNIIKIFDLDVKILLFRIRETDEEIEKRLDKWEKFLDGEDTKKETEKQNSEESDRKTETEAINIVKSESTE